MNIKPIASALLFGSMTLMVVLAQDPPPQTPAQPGQEAPKKKSKRPPPPGVTTAGVKREMTAITPTAVFETGGTPDWQTVTEDAVWVSNGPKDTLHRMDIKTNKLTAEITVGKKPCSGLTAGFGSVWVPNCGDKTVSRVDIKTNTVVATIPVGPADSEGLLATSPEAVWILSDKAAGKLSRIDPKTNTVTAAIDVAPGSVSAYYGDGAIWVASPDKNMLTRVDPKTNKVTDSIEVGPGPRFLTFGAGSVWTLNQGNGTVSRVDAKTRKLVVNIECGLPGGGGEIAFGNGHVWPTLFGIPITEIDPATNTVIKQWVGAGGDSIRVAHGSLWLSNLGAHNVWRVDLAKLQ